MKCVGFGPTPARIMIVGEAPGAEEERSGTPFAGQSGQELTRMLHEAGIIRAECYITNVVKFRPPHNDIEHFIPKRKGDITTKHVYLHDRYVLPVVLEGYHELLQEIEAVQPNVIIACGNISMWALTGRSGIVSWRGSLLSTSGISSPPRKVIPTYHPAAILRQWDWRVVAIHDLKRAKQESTSPELKLPSYRFIVRPGYQETLDKLDWLIAQADISSEGFDLAVDIETRRKHIACIGLAWSAEDALCVPLMCVERRDGYWGEEAELEIILRLRQLLTHPKVKVIGQNFLYDAQYIYRHWRFVPNVDWDTMMAHHVMFLSLPKGLHFLSSLYCSNHIYWKDEGKEWDASIGEDQLWRYNCQDAVRTWEIKQQETQALARMNLTAEHDFQRALWWACLDAMIRGMRIDHFKRPALAKHFEEQMLALEQFLEEVLGHKLNPRSNKQMQTLFYGDFQQQVILHKKTKQPTLDDTALERIAAREPLLRPIISAIGDYRTLGVFKSTFIESELDSDGRMRCTLDPNGTDTLRLSSYENAFGSGMNMQNLPSDKSKALGKAAKRIRAAGMELKLPNIRSLFLPDPEHTIFDLDLDRADLQVVVWESGDELFKQALRDGVDIHLLNAIALAGKELPPLEELIEGKSDRYGHWRSLYKHGREFAKVFCHATNYGASARTVAGHIGISVREAERAQQMWFHAHPGIKEWHKRTEASLISMRSVSNRFGYKMLFFDRVEALLPEALAWVPQSTVACIINRIWVQLLLAIPEIKMLMQVHDSLVGEFPSARRDEILQLIKANSSVVVPYEDPLVIPTGIKVSDSSWGEVK